MSEHPPFFTAKSSRRHQHSRPASSPAAVRSCWQFEQGHRLRLTPAESEHILATFYTWQRVNTSSSSGRGLSSPLPGAPLSSTSNTTPNISATSCGARASSFSLSPQRAAVMQPSPMTRVRMQSLKDVDTFLFRRSAGRNEDPLEGRPVPTIMNASWSGSGETGDRSVLRCGKRESSPRPRNASPGKVNVSGSPHSSNRDWVHRATMKGSTVFPSAMSPDVRYGSPKHVARSIESQLSHVGRMDAAAHHRLRTKKPLSKFWI